mmetsp:Transcript_5139/g.6753  ORF Transcript_5139/g.6753 Transcript_5139/m.6753 type:complete len:401 (-) Transcript_5139:275-1477(-)
MEFETDVTISRKNRRMLCETKNITFWPNIQLVEHTRHEPHPDNPDWTWFQVNATLTLMNLWGLQGAIEQVIMENGKKGQSTARENEKPYIQNIADRPELPGITEIEEQCKADAKLNKDESDALRQHDLHDFFPEIEKGNWSSFYGEGNCCLPTKSNSTLHKMLNRVKDFFFPPQDYAELARTAVVEILSTANTAGDFCWWSHTQALHYPCLVVQLGNYTIVNEKTGFFNWGRRPVFEDAKTSIQEEIQKSQEGASEVAKLCIVFEWDETSNYTLFRALLEVLEGDSDKIGICLVYPTDESFLRCWKLISPDFSNDLCNKFFFIDKKSIYSVSNSLFGNRSEEKGWRGFRKAQKQEQPPYGWEAEILMTQQHSLAELRLRKQSLRSGSVEESKSSSPADFS